MTLTEAECLLALDRKYPGCLKWAYREQARIVIAQAAEAFARVAQGRAA